MTSTPDPSIPRGEPALLGIDFVGLQVRDLAVAAEFYEHRLGLPVAERRPGAVVFGTSPIPIAVREPLPGTDLDAGPAGLGVGLWFGADRPEALHARLQSLGAEIVTAPAPGPFGVQFTLRDLDGYLLTVHGPADGGSA
ncbi:MAG: VOC family protein [Phycicoccus sp.]